LGGGCGGGITVVGCFGRKLRGRIGSGTNAAGFGEG
jgi:hypothetical protein